MRVLYIDALVVYLFHFLVHTTFTDPFCVILRLEMVSLIIGDRIVFACDGSADITLNLITVRLSQAINLFLLLLLIETLGLRCTRRAYAENVGI